MLCPVQGTALSPPSPVMLHTGEQLTDSSSDKVILVLGRER